MLKSLLLLLLPLSLLPAPAVQARQTGPSVHVGYADLDLSQPAGRQRLDRRLSAAIEKVCPPLHRDIGRNAPGKKCRNQTQAQVDGRLAEVLAAHARPIEISAVP